MVWRAAHVIPLSAISGGYFRLCATGAQALFCLNRLRQFSSEADSFGQRPLRRLQSSITPELCARFRRDGYAVVDDVFEEEQADAFRQEIKSLRSFMHKNSTHLVTTAATEYLEKSHIHEAELLSQETQQRAPLCAAVQRDSTLAVLLSLFMPELRLDSQAIKLQYNSGGGGCFPIHFDSDPGVDARRVTAIIYLNPGWREGQGGELRLYPFPGQAQDIQPRNNRMVLFSSQGMAHRVLPSLAERFCFTIWLSGERSPGGQGAYSKEKLRSLLSNTEGLGEEESLRALLHPALYKHACKWVHRHQWAQSLEESHPLSRGREVALAQFWREIGVIERALGPRLLAAAAQAGRRGGGKAKRGGSQRVVGYAGDDGNGSEGGGDSVGMGLPRPSWF